MNRPLIATLTLGLVAAASALVAAFYYPWPEQVQLTGKVGQALFETFSTNQVRSIEVIKFNSDRQGLERLTLLRKGERWVIPSAGEYNADNAIQLGRVISSVQDRKVLDIISEDQEDHVKNGVVDPEEFQTVEQRSGLGQKLVLKDRNGQSLASLIVGSPLQNSEQQSLFCVRVPGEPQVYSIQYDIAALTTRFQDWVSPNLLKIRSQEIQDGQAPMRVTLDAYRVDSTNIATAPRTNLYQAEVGPAGDRLAVRDLKAFSGNDWKPVAPTPSYSNALAEIGMRQLTMLVIPEVRAKPKAVADFLKQPGPVADPSIFQSMHEFGFRQIAAAGQPSQFESSGGEVTVHFENGFKVTIYVGNITGSVQSGTKLNRFMLLLASVDAAALKKPEPPSNADGSNLSEEQQRNYQRELEAWSTKSKNAQELVNDYNQRFAPWYYALAEEVFVRLVPELPGLAGAANMPSTPAPVSPENANKSP